MTSEALGPLDKNRSSIVIFGMTFKDSEQEGTTNTYPRLVMNDPNRNFSRSSDFYVEDGAFFRIKTLQIGYTIPQNVLAKIGMRKARIYLSGNNLVTFTKYSSLNNHCDNSLA